MPTFYSARGEFQTEPPQEIKELSPTKKGGTIGMRMKIFYTDFFLDDAEVVALIQAVRCVAGPNLNELNERKKSDKDGGQEKIIARIITTYDWYIDAPGVDNRVCPAFGMEFGLKTEEEQWKRWLSAIGTAQSHGPHNAAAPKSNGPEDENIKARLGRRGRGTDFTPAFLVDAPTRTWKAGEAYHHHFEVAAVCICSDPDDSRNGAVRGSLTWGYTVDENGKWEADGLVRPTFFRDRRKSYYDPPNEPL